MNPTKKALIGILLGVAIQASATTAWSGVDITTHNSRDEVTTGRIRAKGNLLRIDLPRSPDGRGDSSIVFDANANVMRILQHSEKVYFQIDEKTSDRLTKQMEAARAQMEAQLAKMPPEQQAMMKKLMEQQGLTPPGGKTSKKPEIPSTRKTGKSDTVHGVPCTIYQIERKGSVVGESCVANWSDLTIERRDIAVMEKFAKFQMKMTEAMGSAFSQGQHPFATMDLSNGLPIRARTASLGAAGWESSLASIQKTDPSPDIFSIPPGYEQKLIGEN